MFKSQIAIRKTSAGDVQTQEKKRKQIGIGCGQQKSKYLTDKISDQTFNSHVKTDIFQKIIDCDWLRQGQLVVDQLAL